MTYLVDGVLVESASWDAASGAVVRKTLLNLPAGSSQDAVTDMFVFDSVIAVRLATGKFKFFEIPLVAGNIADEIPIEDEVEGGIIAGTANTFADFLAFGMH